MRQSTQFLGVYLVRQGRARSVLAQKIYMGTVTAALKANGSVVVKAGQTADRLFQYGTQLDHSSLVEALRALGCISQQVCDQYLTRWKELRVARDDLDALDDLQRLGKIGKIALTKGQRKQITRAQARLRKARGDVRD